MHLARRCVLLAVFTMFLGTQAEAGEIVRDPALISSMPIRGVTLDMTPREAFEHLIAMGYNAGNVTSYDEWDTGGLNLVLGDFGAPEGRSEISLSRTAVGERLVNISETLNVPPGQIDSHAEINAIRAHFGIAADDPNCHVNEHDTGACRVGDAAENANHAYGINAFPTMILRYATRNHEMKDSY